MYKIHINQQHIRENAEKKTNLPVITVLDCAKKTKTNVHSLEILGPSKIVYNPDPKKEDQPDLTVKVWIETNSEVKCL